MSIDRLLKLIDEQKVNIDLKDFKIEYYRLMKDRIDKMDYSKDEYNLHQDVKNFIADNYATKTLMEKYKLGEWK